jgi:hypothetical protein
LCLWIDGSRCRDEEYQHNNEGKDGRTPTTEKKGSPMATAITAREVDNEKTLAKATTTCSVGEVEISKTGFITEVTATAAEVKADFDGR